MAKRVDQEQKIDERTGVQDGKVKNGNETHKKDLTRMRGQIKKNRFYARESRVQQEDR